MNTELTKKMQKMIMQLFEKLLKMGENIEIFNL